MMEISKLMKTRTGELSESLVELQSSINAYSMTGDIDVIAKDALLVDSLLKQLISLVDTEVLRKQTENARLMLKNFFRDPNNQTNFSE